jgi:hypothetical protein
MREISSRMVKENKEQVALKVEQLRGSQISTSGGKEHPSKSIKKESWYEMDMHYAHEKETSRSMFIGSDSSETGQTIMEGIDSMSEGEIN